MLTMKLTYTESAVLLVALLWIWMGGDNPGELLLGHPFDQPTDPYRDPF